MPRGRRERLGLGRDRAEEKKAEQRRDDAHRQPQAEGEAFHMRMFHLARRRETIRRVRSVGLLELGSNRAEGKSP